jgi:hypothetical protein
VKSRYRVTLDITLKNFGITPLAHLHAILHNRLTDGHQISALTVVDAHDVSRENGHVPGQPMKDEVTVKGS